MEDFESIQALIDKVSEAEERNFFRFSSEECSLLYTLAYHLYQNGKYTDSKQIFRFLTICEPFDRRYWMGLGGSHFLLKNYAEALECYSVAATQDPNDPYVHLYAADCFFAQNQVNIGIKTLESAIHAAKKSKDNSLLLQLEEMRKAWDGMAKQSLTGGKHGC